MGSEAQRSQPPASTEAKAQTASMRGFVMQHQAHTPTLVCTARFFAYLLDCKHKQASMIHCPRSWKQAGMSGRHAQPCRPLARRPPCRLACASAKAGSQRAMLLCTFLTMSSSAAAHGGAATTTGFGHRQQEHEEVQRTALSNNWQSLRCALPAGMRVSSHRAQHNAVVPRMNKQQRTGAACTHRSVAAAWMPRRNRRQ